MWPDLKEQIAVEQAEIHELIVFHRELLDTCRKREPKGIELTALGAFLHALYSGIENICRRIAIELDGGLPQGGDWHRRLIHAMTHATKARPWVISENLHNQLLGYLDFRHLFRNVYVFRLEWERMMELVLNAEELVEEMNQQIESFIKRTDDILSEENRTSESGDD